MIEQRNIEILNVKRLFCWQMSTNWMWHMYTLVYKLPKDKLWTFSCISLIIIDHNNQPGSHSHSDDVIMSTMAFQITSLTIVYSNRLFRRISKKTSQLRVTRFCEGSSPVTGEFPAKRTVTRKMFPVDDVIIIYLYLGRQQRSSLCQDHISIPYQLLYFYNVVFLDSDFDIRAHLSLGAAMHCLCT